MNKEIEKSIIKKYRKEIWAKFIKAINDYQLVEENDKIAVCISGGKDSFLMAKCLQELLRHNKFNFSLEFVVMDPGYSKDKLANIKHNLKIMEIDAHIFKAPIFDYVKSTDKGCYLCAKMRRGYLYNYAQEIGCNKIALGHHFDDVIGTVLLNMIYNGSFSSMLPILDSEHFDGIKLIRPLYLIREDDVNKWAKYNNLEFLPSSCPVAKEDSKRVKIKELMKTIDNLYEKGTKNILTSTNNVNLDMIMGYKSKNENHFFLDDKSDKI